MLESFSEDKPIFEGRKGWGRVMLLVGLGCQGGGSSPRSSGGTAVTTNRELPLPRGNEGSNIFFLAIMSRTSCLLVHGQGETQPLHLSLILNDSSISTILVDLFSLSLPSGATTNLNGAKCSLQLGQSSRHLRSVNLSVLDSSGERISLLAHPMTTQLEEL